MKVGKPTSKRVPVRLRQKIQKASAAKQRKQRKEAKKNPQWRSRLKKDPGIPNLFPYKNQILSEIEEGRRLKEEDALRKREIAKAQRQGSAVVVGSKVEKDMFVDANEVHEEELLGSQEEEEEEEEEEDQDMVDDEDENQNPMAALLASAQARAQKYSQTLTVSREDDDDDDDSNEEWHEIEDEPNSTAGGSAYVSTTTHKILPKKVLADPIKATSTLMDRLQKTEAVQQILDFYQIPALVTEGNDLTTRFLVELARKRGRLSRGGLPNLHAAALVVLSDLNEERLQLEPTMNEIQRHQQPGSTAAKGEVQIVSKMAEPFRIEGLFGD